MWRMSSDPDLSWSDPDSPFLVRSGFQGPDADSDWDVFKKSASDPILIKKKGRDPQHCAIKILYILINKTMDILLSIAVQFIKFFCCKKSWRNL